MKLYRFLWTEKYPGVNWPQAKRGSAPSRSARASPETKAGVEAPRLGFAVPGERPAFIACKARKN
jgi:hypothetical protein